MIIDAITQCMLVLLTVNCCSADYDVPPAKVEVFYPKGFRVSIPGIKKRCLLQLTLLEQ